MRRSITENFIYNAINSIFTFIIMLALSIVIARQLGPADYGSYNLIVWIFGIIGVISLMGFANAVEKYVSEYDGRRDKETLRKIVGYVLKIELLWGIFVTILFILMADKLSGWLKHPEFENFFLITALITVPSAINTIFISVARGLQNLKSIMLVNIITLPLLLGFILLVLNRGGDVAGILWVQLGTTLTGVLFFCFILKDIFPFRGGLARAVKKKVLSFNLTLLAIMILDLIVWRKSEVFFLALFRSPEEVGYYGLAFSVATMSVKFIADSFGGVIGPVLSNRYGAQDRAGFSQVFTKSTKYLMLMSAPFCIAIVTMARPLVEFIYGKSYLPAAGILPVLAVFSSIGVIGYAAASAIYGTERQNVSLTILSFVAALNLIMDILLIPRYGIYGAAIANSVAQGMDVFLLFLWVHVKMKFTFPIGSVVKTFLAGFIATGIMYFFINMVGGNLLRLIALLIMGEGVYIFIVYITQKEEIKELRDYLCKFFRTKMNSPAVRG